MADTITIRTDSDTERALAILATGDVSRSAAIRQAVLEAAERKERATAMRRAILEMPLGDDDGVNIAERIVAEREGGF